MDKDPHQMKKVDMSNLFTKFDSTGDPHMIGLLCMEQAVQPRRGPFSIELQYQLLVESQYTTDLHKIAAIS